MPAETSMARYDWGRARRGHWAGKLRIGDEDRSRVLDKDLAEIFPDSASVNEATRLKRGVAVAPQAGPAKFVEKAVMLPSHVVGMRVITAGIAAALVCGCGQHDTATTSSLSCSDSLTTYCASASPSCVQHVDPEHVVASYCAAQQSGGVEFGVWTCGDAGTFGIDSQTTSSSTSYYDPSGNLIAIVPDRKGASCTAGPTTFEVPLCRSDLIGHGCIQDAGAD